MIVLHRGRAAVIVADGVVAVATQAPATAELSRLPVSGRVRETARAMSVIHGGDIVDAIGCASVNADLERVRSQGQISRKVIRIVIIVKAGAAANVLSMFETGGE